MHSRRLWRPFGIIALSVLGLSEVLIRAAEIDIDATASGIPLSRDMYGLFWENIGHSADGGLYAELIRNRSFNDNLGPVGGSFDGNEVTTPQGWKDNYHVDGELPAWSPVATGGAKASIALETDHPLNDQQKHSMKLTVEAVNGGEAGFANVGFFGGMAVKKGTAYALSFYARTDDAFRGILTASLVRNDGTAIASAKVEGVHGNWKQYKATLQPADDDTMAHFKITASSPGTLWFNMVSLFPRDTFANHPNGLRRDFAQDLADLHPSFVRFPGGCIAEGCTLQNRIQWKLTIGDVAKRPGQWNLWGYYGSEGVGQLEFGQFADDIGAVGMYVVNVGMSCQFRNPEFVAVDQLQPYVQDALDGISYLIDPASAGWGRRRALDGHPAPFHLKYVEIGNENWGDEYKSRYPYFYKAIHEKYPQLLLITDTDPRNHDTLREHPPVGDLPTEIADEHFYEPPFFFFQNTHRYDSYDRKGPKVYVGEWGATQEHGFRASLSEAAFMTGLERNADVVIMFSTVLPALVRHNQAECIRTTQYFTEQLFSTNRPDVVLPTEIKAGDERLYATAGMSKQSHELIVKLVNAADHAIDVTIHANGATATHARAKMLTSDDPLAQNNFNHPDRVVPMDHDLGDVKGDVPATLPAMSLTILRIATARK